VECRQFCASVLFPSVIRWQRVATLH